MPTPTPPAPTGIEKLVCEEIARRQQFGINKYGVSVADNPLSLKEWLIHSFQEKLDDVIYMRRAIQEIEDEERWNGGSLDKEPAPQGDMSMEEDWGLPSRPPGMTQENYSSMLREMLINDRLMEQRVRAGTWPPRDEMGNDPRPKLQALAAKLLTPEEAGIKEESPSIKICDKHGFTITLRNGVVTVDSDGNGTLTGNLIPTP